MPTRPAQHRPAGWKPYKEEARQVKRRQTRRALPTNSTTWRKIRAVHLAGEPLCRHCALQNRVTAATDVDHVDGDDANNDRSNLQSLCRSCHSAKTVRENGGFGQQSWNPNGRTRFHERECYPQKPERKGRGEAES